MPNADIMFMDDLGEANKLNHEIEYYDNNTGHLDDVIGGYLRKQKHIRRHYQDGRPQAYKTGLEPEN